MQVRTHLGMSRDGFIATPNCLRTWDALPAFDQDTHSYNAFIAQYGAIAMGSTSFDQGYGGRQ